MPNQKAVVTGLGIVCPVAGNKREFLEALREGRDGAGPITRFAAGAFPVKRACEVKNFELLAGGPDPYIQFGLAAAEEAVRDSGIDFGVLDPWRIGIAASSSKGGVTRFEHGSMEDFSPDRLNFQVARRYGLKGPMICVVAACATGTYAVIEGARWIERGDADAVLAGASDASITRLMLAGYHQLGVHSSNGMCPYDKKRSGFLVGEGAGMVLLESEALARSRGARVYGAIAGYATGNDPYRATAFDPEADELAYLLKKLLQKTGIRATDIDYFNTHGTSTVEGDLYETRQIKKAFGPDAYKIPFSSTKSMVGHMLGASGAVELIACLLAMEAGLVPPTIHLEQPDPECDLDYTPNLPKIKNIRLACSISLGFGGHLGGLLIAK